MNSALEPIADSFQLSDFQVFKSIFSAKYSKKTIFFTEKTVVIGSFFESNSSKKSKAFFEAFFQLSATKNPTFTLDINKEN